MYNYFILNVFQNIYLNYNKFRLGETYLVTKNGTERLGKQKLN